METAEPTRRDLSQPDFEALYAQWREANQAATAAEHIVDGKLRGQRDGQGPGPSRQEVESAQRLRDRAVERGQRAMRALRDVPHA